MTRRGLLAAISAIGGTRILAAAVRGQEVMYVGGTISGLPEATEGEVDTSDAKIFKFNSSKGSFEIPYQGITSIEYGQKAGRRLGVALTITVWALFSKKRKHFLTIGFKDAKDAPQGVVIEVPKGKPKSIITILEARSGLKCEYESEEARKHVHG
ncbi:MAG: hypothetical protein JNL98_16505 [Bryobacterales bacterium]|nr:hypothetical protein [Bryobacterales bacterium]